MKIALSGKGGVGKTTLTALLARQAAARGHPVLVIDADSNPNLHLALGFPSAPPALVGMKELIEERLGSLEGFFRLILAWTIFRSGSLLRTTAFGSW